MQAKQAVSPLQTAEVSNIRRKTASFDVEQYNFREEFRKQAPFLYNSSAPYQKLDEVSLFYSRLPYTGKRKKITLQVHFHFGKSEWDFWAFIHF